MGASPCLDVMYDQQFTKDFVYLINRLNPILLYWHHDCKILLTPPWQMGLAELWWVRARLTLQVVVYDEYTDGPRWCSQLTVDRQTHKWCQVLPDSCAHLQHWFFHFHYLHLCHLPLELGLSFIPSIENWTLWCLTLLEIGSQWVVMRWSHIVMSGLMVLVTIHFGFQMILS